MESKIKKIAVYGKGGIGKSTTTCHLAVALACKGYRVMQIGCDPKADSTKNLMNGQRIATVLDQMQEKGDRLTLQDIVFAGYKGVLCVESGGPKPGTGCAGRCGLRRVRHADSRWICQRSLYRFFRRNDVVVCSFQHSRCR